MQNISLASHQGFGSTRPRQSASGLTKVDMRASAKATTTKNLSRTSTAMVGKCLDIPLDNIDHATSLTSSDGQQFVDAAIAVVFNPSLVHLCCKTRSEGAGEYG